MAVDYEPKLAPPQLSDQQPLFNVGVDSVRAQAIDTNQRGLVDVDAGKYNHDGKADKTGSAGSRHNRLKVHAWEGTLPRLGFGFIDLELLVDYEKRPKTPNFSFVRPPRSPARLSSPPYTPEDKHVRLSAGLVLPVPVVGPSSSSATYTATASAIHDSTRNESTLQSSPPAPIPDTTPKCNFGVQAHQYKQSGTSVGLWDINSGASASSNTAGFERQCHLESREASNPLRPASTVGTTQSASPNGTDLYCASVSLCVPNSPVQSELKPVGRLAQIDVDSPDWLGLIKTDPSFIAKNRISISRSTYKSDSPVYRPDPRQYLEVLRAAIQSTPQSCRSADREVSVKATSSGASNLNKSLVISDEDWSAVSQRTGKFEVGEVRLPCSEATTAPSVLQSPTKVHEDEVYTVLGLRYERSPEQVARFRQNDSRLGPPHHETSASINDKPHGILANANFDDDDDDETGGCSVSAAIKSTQQAVSRPDTLRFPRKRPSQADKLIQDAFRAQVQEMASFSAQFQPEPLLTKEEKFDNLIKKLIVKNIFHNNGNIGKGGDVHVFVDMSNIFIGFQDCAKVSQGLHTSARVTFSPFCFEHLAFVLERGRKTVKRQLAGSVRQAYQMNNLPSHIRDAQFYGFETKILHQVTKLDPNQPFQNSPYTSGDEAFSGVLCPRTKLGEQGVDEALHLSMQDSILDTHGNPGIMVLATGDAKPAEYSDGFAHYALKALKHGWHVEVVSWRRCLSSEWKKSPFKDKYAEQFRIILLDDYFDEIRANWLGESSTVLARV